MQYLEECCQTDLQRANSRLKRGIIPTRPNKINRIPVLWDGTQLKRYYDAKWLIAV